MRRKLIGVALSLALVAAPAAPAARPLGVVVQAENARLDGTGLLSGETVFAGASVSAAPGGTLRVRMGGAQVYLLADSAARFGEQEGWTVAELRRGGAGFSTSGSERVVLRVDEVQVYAATNQPTHAEVTRVGTNQLRIASLRGALEVMVGGEVYAVPSATVSNLSLGPAPQELEGVGKEKERRRRVIGFVLVGAGAAAIVAGIVLYQQRDPVSPFVAPVRPFPTFFGN